MSRIIVRDKKELELLLAKIPRYRGWRRELEQYETPSSIVSHILWLAYLKGDVYSKNIAEPGCGTGVFSIGALLLGASKSICIDIDNSILEHTHSVVKNIFRNLSHRLILVNSDIRDLEVNSVDTVIMNPPFGVYRRNRGLDLFFLRKAMGMAYSIYSLHKYSPMLEEIITDLSRDWGFDITYSERLKFPIPMMYPTHRRRIYIVETVLYVFRKRM
ncbi:MAG: METTL5 family protein [Desulfurococcaceae archaeon]